jgi:hypothetical protein
VNIFTDFKQSGGLMKANSIKLSNIFILAIGFFVYSCGDLAVTQQVNDTDQLIPIISLTGTFNSRTRVYRSKISVLLKNINNTALEIEGGYVKVNGYKMEPPATALISPYYHNDYVLESDIIPDELYVFEIVLSNKETYRAWIESPEIFPTTFDVSQRIKRDTMMTVKWQDTDYRYPQYLILQNYVKDKGFSADDQVKLKIDEPYYGYYTVDKKYINYQDVSDKQINETRVILQAQTEGLLDQRFSQKGTITCTFKIYADLEIY